MYWAWYVKLYCAWSSFLQNWDRRIINKMYYYYRKAASDRHLTCFWGSVAVPWKTWMLLWLFFFVDFSGGILCVFKTALKLHLKLFFFTFWTLIGWTFTYLVIYPRIGGGGGVTHWNPFVFALSQLMNCVKFEVAVLVSPSLIVPMVSVDVKQQWTWTFALSN